MFWVLFILASYQVTVKQSDDELIKLLINVRHSLKKEKNFALADLIRDELNKLGIILQDTKEGATYKKK